MFRAKNFHVILMGLVQHFEVSFSTGGGGVFKNCWIRYLGYGSITAKGEGRGHVAFNYCQLIIHPTGKTNCGEKARS